MKLSAVILDLGGVLVNLDYERAYRELSTRFPGLTRQNFCGTASQAEEFDRFETGRMGEVEFMTGFFKRHQVPVDLSWFRAAWNSMILDVPEGRLEFLERLGRQQRLFLYSNINSIHHEYFYGLFDPEGPGVFERLFEKTYYSHLFGFRKPDAAGFLRIIEEQGLNPEETLFVDDSPQHVAGAEKVGLHAVHLSSGERVEECLQRLGAYRLDHP
jgi:FMN phosphatase YigB (HAD superfamily)